MEVAWQARAGVKVSLHSPLRTAKGRLRALGGKLILIKLPSAEVRLTILSLVPRPPRLLIAAMVYKWAHF